MQTTHAQAALQAEERAAKRDADMAAHLAAQTEAIHRLFLHQQPLAAIPTQPSHATLLPFVHEAYAGMMASGAHPHPTIIPVKTKHLAALARFANGGTIPSPLIDTARVGAEVYKLEMWMDRIRTGTTVNSKATWDPLSFVLIPGSVRPTSMALSKDSALLLHGFELGTNGFGIQNVIPLHAGFEDHDVSAGTISSWDNQLFTIVGYDNRLLDNPTPSDDPLPSIPFTEGSVVLVSVLPLFFF